MTMEDFQWSYGSYLSSSVDLKLAGVSLIFTVASQVSDSFASVVTAPRKASAATYHSGECCLPLWKFSTLIDNIFSYHILAADISCWAVLSVISHIYFTLRVCIIFWE